MAAWFYAQFTDVTGQDGLSGVAVLLINLFTKFS